MFCIVPQCAVQAVPPPLWRHSGWLEQNRGVSSILFYLPRMTQREGATFTNVPPSGLPM